MLKKEELKEQNLDKYEATLSDLLDSSYIELREVQEILSSNVTELIPPTTVKKTEFML